MKYYEEFLSRITKSEYLEIYDNLDIEKMKKIVQENIDYLIKLKGEKAVEEMINNDKLIEYFQWLVKEKTILYISKEFITYIYLIKERFGGKVLEDLISMLIKYEEIFQISTTFIIETIGKNIENLDDERIKVLLEILGYLMNEKYKLRITMYTALSESLNLIVDKDIDIKIVRDFMIKVIGSFSGEPYLIIKLKDRIPKEKFAKLLNVFSSNGLYYKVQNEEDLEVFLNQIIKDPSIIDLINKIDFEKIKARDFLFILTKYFENIYFNEKINQEIKLEIFNQLINKGGRIVRYIIIHTSNKRLKLEDYDKLYNVINLMGKDLFTKYPNILKYYPQFVSFRLYRLINSEKDLEYLEEELAKKDPYELIYDYKVLKGIYQGPGTKYLAELFEYIIKKYGKKRRLIIKILDSIEEMKKFDKYNFSEVFMYALSSVKDNIGKIGAWCNYFSNENIYYWCIYKNVMKKLKKMSR
ncbi:MAG: hypothetical protein GU343_02965 [Nanoarchaeota archaeon]|jgi:hypothetical protein|nr:hypothetical protein [Nanoarchaeota archaeon]